MSKNTENYKLYTFTSDTDVADLKLLEPTFDTIDKGLVLDVGESTGSGNNYILNLGSITLTSANKGISFKFWSDKDSKGAVTINGTYKLIKAGGSSVTNLKKGAPYVVTYNGGTNFFLASGGGADTVTFTSDKLLTGYSANDSNGEKVNGTMANQGAKTASLNCGGSYTIPAGYHNGSGKVTANSVSSQTSANAAAKDIIKGKTAWVNGSKLTGTATVESLGGIPILYSVTMNGIKDNYIFPYTTASDVNYVVIIMKDNTNNKVYITSRYATTNYPSYFYTQTTVTNDLFKSDYSISGYMNTGGLKFKGNISGNVTITVIKFM